MFQSNCSMSNYSGMLVWMLIGDNTHKHARVIGHATDFAVYTRFYSVQSNESETRHC